MATVTGLTAARMLAIEAASVVDGEIDVSGHLILTTHGGSTIDAGSALVAIGDATETTPGKVELATTAETTTGTDATRVVTPAGLAAVTATRQPLDSDLTAIAALSPANDDIAQRKSGAWTNRTMGQLATDLLATGSFAGGGGSTYVPFVTIGPTGSGASLITDGTADDVQIQSAIDTLRSTTGGLIMMAPGTYNLAATVNFIHPSNGLDYESPSVRLIGAGPHATKIIAANNVNAFSISGGICMGIENMTIKVQGSGSGIVSTNNFAIVSLYQAFMLSSFRNLYIAKQGASAHTGWAMDLGSPFRSQFANIEIFGLHNGIRLKSENANFNPGDCTFERIFIEMDTVAGSTALSLLSTNSMGSLNQCTFNMVEMIDAAASGTGILLSGTGGGGSNHNMFTGINSEQFATVLDVTTGFGNRFDFNYVESMAAGTFFKTGSGSGGNHIRSVGFAYVGAKTNTFINDANTDLNQPNIFEDMHVGVDSGGTASATTTTATRIRNTKGYNAGTLGSALSFQKTEYGEVYYWNGSAFVRAQGAKIYVGGSSDPTTANGDIWIH